MMLPNTDKGGSGFTLVELMVSVALASIMMGIVSMVFFTAGRLTREADSKVEIHTEARFILDKIAGEIASANVHSIYVDTNNGPFVSESGGNYDSDKDYRNGAVAFSTIDLDGKASVIAYALDSGNVTSPIRLVRESVDISTSNTDLKTRFIDAADRGSWSTMSENVLSFELRLYPDYDLDGRINEDPGYPSGNSLDDDQDGLVDEDPPATYGPVPTTTDRLYFNEWTGAKIADGLGSVPAFIDIRMVVRDTEDRERRLFTRMVRLNNYLAQ